MSVLLSIDCRAILFSREVAPQEVINDVSTRLGALSTFAGEESLVWQFRGETGIPDGFLNAHVFKLPGEFGYTDDKKLTHLEGRIGLALMGSETSLIPGPHGVYGEGILWVGLSYPALFPGSEDVFKRYMQ